MSSTTTPRTVRPARRAAPFVVLGVVVLAGAALVLADRAGVPLPPCPFHALTGLDCPGCGGTRAALALGRGDLASAVDHHVLLVAALPLLLAGWVVWARTAWRGSPRTSARPVVTSRVLTWVVALLLAFAVLRNLPGVPLLDAA